MTPGMKSAGGMNVYLRRIAPWLAKEGVTVDVFTRSHHAGGPETFEFDDGSRVVHIPAGNPELQKEEIYPYLIDYTDGLLEAVRVSAESYDLVHSHYWLSAKPGARLAQALNIPHVFTYHTIAEVKERAGGAPEAQLRKSAEAAAVQAADAIVTFTGEESAALSGLYGVPAHRLHPVPMGVDSTLFKPRSRNEARERLRIGPEEDVLLFVGRMESFKGPDLLIQALSEMPTRDRVRLVMVGGAVEEHSFGWLQCIAEELGIHAQLDWRHAIPQRELPDYYNAANVCVVPSWHETFGMTALEAMACGTPVVASNVGGLRTIVANGETGYLVTVGKTNELARALDDLITNPSKAQLMGEAGIARAAQFTWQESATKLLGLYKALVSLASVP